jgi:hypothetical protein
VCNKERNSQGCESDEKIAELLDILTLSQASILGNVQLKDQVNPTSNPVSYMNWFMFKVKLDMEQFTEQDNFVKYNSVSTKDDRLNFLGTESYYSFANF